MRERPGPHPLRDALKAGRRTCVSNKPHKCGNRERYLNSDCVACNPRLSKEEKERNAIQRIMQRRLERRKKFRRLLKERNELLKWVEKAYFEGHYNGYLTNIPYEMSETYKALQRYKTL